jgi:predicted nucleic acid-binding protein
MARLYFDSSYVVRLYLIDEKTELVKEVTRGAEIASSVHGRTEVIAAFHRAFREGRFSQAAYRALVDQFCSDEEEKSAFEWIWPEADFFKRAERIYREASKKIFLRAADAMHLACAAENGFREIYSNDRHLLAAAPLFGLKAKNVIA